MYRKMAIIFISIFMRRFGKMSQALILFILVMVFISLTYKWKPYSTHNMNEIEAISLMTSILSIYCGLFFIADIDPSNQEPTESNIELTESSKMFFFVCILFSNFVFFAYWSVMMYKETVNQFRIRFQRVYLYLFLCGNV